MKKKNIFLVLVGCLLSVCIFNACKLIPETDSENSSSETSSETVGGESSDSSPSGTELPILPWGD